jgi:hypothetical protein
MRRYLKNLKHVPSAKALVGRWVIEFSWCPTYELPHGWHSLRFGIYKVKNEVPEGMVTVHPANISGLYRSYCIWLPIIRRNY